MRRAVPVLAISFLVAACGSSHSAAPTPSGTGGTQSRPTGTQTASTAGTPPGGHATSVSVATRPTATPPVAQPTPAATPSTGYLGFLAATCHAFAAADATTIGNELPYYQYNNGLRYGVLGDGEGQTGDPSLLGTWLQGGTVHCQYYTPDIAGHGTLLTSGWKQPGGWSLIELDTFNGAWKINDFTFGDRAALYQAMQTAQPILPYHGR